MQLVLRKFDISSIPDNSIIALISKRNGGKTTCLKDIMYYHKDIPVGTIISPTESSNKSYNDMVPSLFIHEEYSPKLIGDLINRQKTLIKKVNRDMSVYGKTNIDPRAFLILDDCMYDKIWTKDKNMRYIFQNGRHQKLLCIFTLQYVLGIPPDLRCNVDYTFIFRENNINNRKRLYENYCSVIPTYDMFSTIMDTVTEGFGCLVINNISRSSKLEDCVFWFEADVHPPFSVGSREFWQKHNECAAADNDDDAEEQFDPLLYQSKKNKNIPMLNIKKTY